MMWWNDGMGWGGWTAMAVIMVAFWALVIFAFMAAFGHTGEGKQQTPTPNLDPQAMLRERFARGEIDADEFDVRKKALRAHE